MIDPLLVAFASSPDVDADTRLRAALEFVRAGGAVTLTEYAALSPESRDALRQAKEEHDAERVAHALERAAVTLEDLDEVRDLSQREAERIAEEIAG